MEGASFEQIFMLLSMLVLRLSFSMGCLFIVQCTEIQRISTWKKYNSFQISKSKSHLRKTSTRNHRSNKFFFLFFFHPSFYASTKTAFLDGMSFSKDTRLNSLQVSKYPTNTRNQQIGDYPATNYPRISGLFSDKK